MARNKKSKKTEKKPSNNFNKETSAATIKIDLSYSNDVAISLGDWLEKDRD